MTTRLLKWSGGVWFFALALLGASCVANTPVQTNVTVLRPAPMLGVMVNQALQIVGVLPKSQAESGGLQVGDVIKSVNGKEVKAARAVQRAFHSQDYTKPTVLVVERDGIEQTFEIVPGEIVRVPGTPGVPLPTDTPVTGDVVLF
jgi:S1-C subfamily serine protease